MAGGAVDATGVVVKDRFRAFLSNFAEAALPGAADASFSSQSQQSQTQKVRARTKSRALIAHAHLSPRAPPARTNSRAAPPPAALRSSTTCSSCWP